MSRRDALRGYLLHIAANTDEPVTLSSEEIWVAFASEFEDFNNFDQAFSDALVWLSEGGFVRFGSRPAGTNGECAVVDLVATPQGVEAERQASVQTPELNKKIALNLDSADMLGCFIGERQNSEG